MGFAVLHEKREDERPWWEERTRPWVASGRQYGSDDLSVRGVRDAWELREDDASKYSTGVERPR